MTEAAPQQQQPIRLFLVDDHPLVRDGLRDLRRGKMVSVPDWKYKTMVFAVRHMPRPLLRRVASDTRGRIGRDQDK